MLDPNISHDVISDSVLLEEFINPVRFKRMNLYAIMSRRANWNEEIKFFLFKQILSEDARSDIILGDIRQSWLPAIFLLREGTDSIKLELKDVLKFWTLEEKVSFLNYIKSEEKFYSFLFEIVEE